MKIPNQIKVIRKFSGIFLKKLRNGIDEMENANNQRYQTWLPAIDSQLHLFFFIEKNFMYWKASCVMVM